MDTQVDTYSPSAFSAQKRLFGYCRSGGTGRRRGLTTKPIPRGASWDSGFRSKEINMNKQLEKTGAIIALLIVSAVHGVFTNSLHAAEPVKVTVFNFVRAESDMTFDRYVKQGAFGNFLHIRNAVPIDKQDVIRMNRDTLYSMGIFDLTKPVTITKPEAGGRFQSMLIINQDHSMLPVEHGSGSFTLTRRKAGTRYAVIVFRTFVNPSDPNDVKAANTLQDRIKVKQDEPGKFEIPNWDETSLGKIRDTLLILASDITDSRAFFGDKKELDPVKHLLGTAYGWGGNPKEGAVYDNVVPEKNDGTVPYRVTVKDVPVDAFWSVTVYNAKGFLEKNDLGIYSYNNVTAKPNDDGSFTINFGGDPAEKNYIPTTKGWSIIVRMYQPRKELIDGSWKFPSLQEVK